MPTIGETRQGYELGYKNDKKRVWLACEGCGKERWVVIEKGQPLYRICNSCSKAGMCGENSRNWRGGRTTSKDGYIYIRLQPDDFFFPMTESHRNVFEHRLVVAKTLGRCLLPWEIVHHKGKKYPAGSIEDKQDNRYPENLQLLPTASYHVVDSITKRHIRNLKKRIAFLEARILILEGKLRQEMPDVTG